MSIWSKILELLYLDKPNNTFFDKLAKIPRHKRKLLLDSEIPDFLPIHGSVDIALIYNAGYVPGKGFAIVPVKYEQKYEV